VNTAINPSGQGVGFAIPINLAMKVVDQLRTNGSVSRGYLGLLPRELTSDLRSAVDLPDDANGVFVERVDKGTPAEEGGLQAGDVITEFAGKKIKDVTQFRMLVADQKPGQSVTAEVWRDGKTHESTFMLGDRAKLASFLGRKEKDSGEDEAPAKEKWLGIEVEPITEAVARALNLDDRSGVIITDVDPDGPAADKLQERDVIIEIDRKPVDSVDDFRDISQNLKREKRAILFRVIRNGQRTFEAIEP
jgi:serine protease Do